MKSSEEQQSIDLSEEEKNVELEREMERSIRIYNRSKHHSKEGEFKIFYDREGTLQM